MGLFVVGVVAGFVDAIAGGGGLLTVPSLFLTGLDPHLALGTNKGQGVFGTGTSLQRFWRSPLLDRSRAVRSFIPALAGGIGGVLLLMHVRPGVLRPLVLAMLAGVAVFMIAYRVPAIHERRERGMLLTVVVAFGLAFYDGFFGPGTGTFLIVAYVCFWGDALDSASANAKVVNFGSNLGSMVTFWWLGRIVWGYALPMALGQVVGGYLGAHTTIRAGRHVVRPAVVVVSIVLIGKLVWDLLRK